MKLKSIIEILRNENEDLKLKLENLEVEINKI